MRPRIAAIIPFFNADDFFPEAIQSVLAQSRPADEIVVVDDASNPARARTLASLPPGVRLVRHEANRGVGAARNSGVAATTADILAFLDADDIWTPDKLARQEAAFLARREWAGCHTGVVAFFRDGSERVYLDKPDELAFPGLLQYGQILPSSLMIRRSALTAMQGFSEDRRAFEDWDLTIRMVAAGHRLGFVREPLLRLRRFDHGNISSSWRRNTSLHLHTVWKNRDLYRRHLGWSGTRQVVGLYLRSGGERKGGLAGRAIHAAGWLVGHELKT